jgi:hypothetical protein
VQARVVASDQGTEVVLGLVTDAGGGGHGVLSTNPRRQVDADGLRPVDQPTVQTPYTHWSPTALSSVTRLQQRGEHTTSEGIPTCSARRRRSP